jgi:hypothetical protein
MDVCDQKSYRDLEVALEKHRKLNSNLLVVTVPGMGVSRLLKEYVKRNKEKGVKYIGNLGDKTGIFNIVDLDRRVNIGEIDSLIRGFVEEKKWALVVWADKLTADGWVNSYVFGHAYGRYYLQALSKEDVEISAKLLDSGLKKEEIGKIYDLSGGLAKIMKYLVVNGTDGKSDGLKVLINEVLGGTLGLEEGMLEKMKIKKDGKYLSKLVEEHVGQFVVKTGLDIKIDFDLSFWEAGEKNQQKLTPDEKRVLEKMLVGGGKATKEEVAEAKWGEGKYDKFSDQAIGKAMRRLGVKLAKYKIETVPRVGFEIKVK